MIDKQDFDLATWVDYIQTLHVREIDLSLARVKEVYQRIYPNGVPYTVVTIAGTNGKGSTAEIVASIYRAAGYKVGKFTSPHLTRFNERFNLEGSPIDDSRLLAALQRIEAAREDVRLTFFEFGALVAIEVFAQAEVDIAVMEVGLGGRLDAVNILEPNVCIITSIGKDHTAWLGDTVDEISLEKLGIARPQVPCVIGMRNPPLALLEASAERYLTLMRHGREFSYLRSGDAGSWRYIGLTVICNDLPLPFGQANHQLENAASAICAVEQLQKLHPVEPNAIKNGIKAASNPGRCQIVRRNPTIVLDVAHNTDSVKALSHFIAGLNVTGRVIAVCGMLKDKEIAASLNHMVGVVDEWYFASINSARGANAVEVKTRLIESISTAVMATLHECPQDAYDQALTRLKKDDCLVVFGSFFVVGDIIQEINI